jgi:hypothetical protein
MTRDDEVPAHASTARATAPKKPVPERRPLRERIAELAADYRRHPLSGVPVDKPFFDELSGND